MTILSKLTLSDKIMAARWPVRVMRSGRLARAWNPAATRRRVTSAGAWAPRARRSGICVHVGRRAVLASQTAGRPSGVSCAGRFRRVRAGA